MYVKQKANVIVQLGLLQVSIRTAWYVQYIHRGDIHVYVYTHAHLHIHTYNSHANDISLKPDLTFDSISPNCFKWPTLHVTLFIYAPTCTHTHTHTCTVHKINTSIHDPYKQI